MKAENLNGEDECGLERFAQLIKNANTNLALQKLNDYGLIDEELNNSVKDCPSPTKELKLSPVKKEVFRKPSDGDKRMPIQKNPFKLKLKAQLGL
jgi:hypothetical protein